VPVSAEAVLNPAATIQDGRVVLLLRVENTAGYSSNHVARTGNGVDNRRMEKKPLLQYGLREWRYERRRCEDVRVVRLEENSAAA